MLWQIRIDAGQFMAGLHTFRSKHTAVAWASNYLRAEGNKGPVALLKDGSVIARLSKKEAS
jgi:hypothetical protein